MELISTNTYKNNEMNKTTKFNADYNYYCWFTKNKEENNCLL